MAGGSGLLRTGDLLTEHVVIAALSEGSTTLHGLFLWSGHEKSHFTGRLREGCALPGFGIAEAAASGLLSMVMTVPFGQRTCTLGLGTPAAEAARKARTTSLCLN
jgi:hypothetical protein